MTEDKQDERIDTLLSIIEKQQVGKLHQLQLPHPYLHLLHYQPRQL